MGKAIKVILALAVIGAFAAAFFFMRKPDPQTIMRAAQKNTVAARTFQWDLSLKARGALSASGLKGGPADAEVAGTVRAAVNRTTPGRTASAADFAFTVRQGGAEKRLAGESSKKDGIHYLKLEETGPLTDEELQALKGKWVKSAAPFLRWLFPDETASGKPFGAAEAAAMQAAVDATDLFVVTGVLPDEKEDGLAAHHYAIKVNAEAATALLLKRLELMTGTAATSDDLVRVTLEVAAWGHSAGDIVITKQDRRVRRLTLATTVTSEDGAMDLSGTARFSRYGEPVEVDAPTDAEDLEKFLARAIEGRLRLSGDRGAPAPRPVDGSASGTTSLAAPETDTDADSDGDGLTDSQEFFYKSDSWNPDTDGDGYADGQEFATGMNPAGPGALFSFGLGN